MSRVGQAWNALWARPATAAPALPAVQASTDGGILITNAQQLDDYLKSGATTASGESVNPDSALRIAAVFAAIRIRSGVPANLPFDVKRRVSDKVRSDATDHPLWSVLKRRPNRWQTPSEFKRMLTAHMLLRGNGYALIVRSRGRVIELVPLNPERMKVEQVSNLALEYSYVRKDGGRSVLSQSDVLHLRGLTLDGITGVSPITYAREAIGLAMTTERHGASLFKNGASLGLVLEFPTALTPAARDNLKAGLEDYRGAANAGKSLILEEGMKANDKVGMTSEDAQYLDTRKYQRTDIFMFYGVPPFMAGDTEKSTSWGSGIEQQKIGFTTFTAEDDLTAWEEAINRDCLGDDEPDIYARFNRSALLRGDINTRWNSYVKGLQWGVLNPDEVRSFEDMNPREDGKGGDYYDPPNTAGGEQPQSDSGGKTDEPAPAP